MSYKFNPLTGNFDYYSSSTSGDAYAAQVLKISRIASEDILEGEMLKADSPTHCSLATSDTNAQDAMAIGIALNNALTGETVDILLLGVAENTSFTIFSLNSPLYLDINGGITDTKKLSGYHVPIGKSLGGNQIFISIESPTVIS